MPHVDLNVSLLHFGYRYQLKFAGQQEKIAVDPLDLLECSSFSAAGTVTGMFLFFRFCLST